VTDYLLDRLVAAVGDHYIIEAELGRGGMAAVFRALDVRLNRRVAIKLLPPELAFNNNVRSRFLREAQMAAQLTHPNIVPIYTVDERESLVYFVMALVDGESAAARLGREGSLPIEHVRAIIGDVADALDYAHRQGVVHRDIKPDNILLDAATGRPMVTDFGIARAAAEEQRLTVTGMAVGTPAYMSPEQAMGERDVDGRSDIYSLGIVAYQMLAGETPFKATNTPAMLMKHVSEPPQPLRRKRPDVPQNLANAIERSLAKKPEDRWRSAAEMRDAVLDRTMARAYEPPPLAPVVSNALPATPESFGRPASPLTHDRGFSAGLVFQVPPPGLSRRERREWYREQRDNLRHAVKYGAESFATKPRTPEERIARFRRNLASYGGTTLLLFGINMVTYSRFPWFIFPALGMLVPLVTQLGSLWGDGVSLQRIFFGSNQAAGGEIAASAVVQTSTAETMASKEILDGAHGSVIRRAVGSRGVILEILGKMTKGEREMLPSDLDETVRALLDRVVSVATTLHRLDLDANGGVLGSLDQRIDALKKDPRNPETERRLALLERQRSTLRDLIERRGALLAQLESASLALENLKLDLVRFRSAGVSSALEDVTSATREARAVSREIGHLLDAQDEVKRL
jgi:serine/threonine-protein kinase